MDNLSPRAAPPRDALSRSADSARVTAYRSLRARAAPNLQPEGSSGGDGATKVDGDHRGKSHSTKGREGWPGGHTCWVLTVDEGPDVDSTLHEVVSFLLLSAPSKRRE
jgi:hypothetical protein